MTDQPETVPTQPTDDQAGAQAPVQPEAAGQTPAPGYTPAQEFPQAQAYPPAQEFPAAQSYAPAPGYPQAPGYPPAAGYPAAAPADYYGEQLLSPSDQRMWALFAHIGSLIVGFWAPLLIWLILRRRGAYVESQSKEALNFQITVIIASIVSGLLCFVFIGFLLLPVVAIGALVLQIMAAVAANKGEPYRYPVNIRMVS